MVYLRFYVHFYVHFCVAVVRSNSGNERAVYAVA
jgi:hypothetical protein